MKWDHPVYTAGDWKLWFAWSPIILAETGKICWLEIVWRKQIPYQSQEMAIKTDHYVSKPTPKQWWLYAKDKNKILIPTIPEGYYEVL